jgi:ubiquitin C-terminal hydrolase
MNRSTLSNNILPLEGYTKINMPQLSPKKYQVFGFVCVGGRDASGHPETTTVNALYKATKKSLKTFGTDTA